MKILFVRPRPSPETIGLQHVMIVEPLELEVLARLVGKNDIPVIIDMILEKRPVAYFINREKPDMLCVTGYMTNVPAMIRYCRIAKTINPEIKTIVGGVHCEVCPKDLDDNDVDFRVVRNAAVVFPLLLEHIQGRADLPEGVFRSNEKVSPAALPPFDFSFPIPDRTLTARYRKKYFYIFHNRIALIKTAFGCPFSCNFCFCRKITDGQYFKRPIKEVIRELKTIKEKEIYIVDDDFLTSRTRVLNFIEAVQSAQLSKHYLLYGRSDFIVQNPDTIQRFRTAGLKTVIIGFESFFDHELKRYNKTINAKTNEQAMKVLKENHIDCFGTIILPPDWGNYEFSMCRKKLLDLGIHYVNLQPLTPLPGTDQVVDDNKLLIPYSDFPKWDLAHISIRPEKMSVHDYYANILELYRAVLLQPAYLFGYMKKYSLPMLWKMMKGSFLVHSQYRRKIKEV